MRNLLLNGSAALVIACAITGCATTNTMIDYVQELTGHTCRSNCRIAHTHSWTSARTRTEYTPPATKSSTLPKSTAPKTRSTVSSTAQPPVKQTYARAQPKPTSRPQATNPSTTTTFVITYTSTGQLAELWSFYRKFNYVAVITAATTPIRKHFPHAKRTIHTMGAGRGIRIPKWATRPSRRILS